MKFYLKEYLRVAGLTISFLVASCSLTTFQSPMTVKPGHTILGIGVAGLYNLGSENEVFQPVEIDLYTRMGLTQNLDLGFKVANFGLVGDVKYQILEKPLFVSIDLGGSYYPRTEGGGAENEGEHYVVYSSLLFGQENLYAGLKYIYVGGKIFNMDGTVEDYTYKLPGIMIGASTPGKLQVVP